MIARIERMAHLLGMTFAATGKLLISTGLFTFRHKPGYKPDFNRIVAQMTDLKKRLEAKASEQAREQARAMQARSVEARKKKGK